MIKLLDAIFQEVMLVEFTYKISVMDSCRIGFSIQNNLETQV